MDQAQSKALLALQPFLVEATTTKNPSPRFLRELIVRATSAANTYIFTELLQLPSIQSLRNADAESQTYLTLLEHFSWGTYAEYISNSSLPKLNDAQTHKLRLLSLLTLASPFAPVTADASDPLSYTSLMTNLHLPTPKDLESLVTTAIYSSLLTARLSPNSAPPRVHITSVAPLRDLRPLSLPALSAILATWSTRCDAVITDLQTQISSIQATARARGTLQKQRQNVVDDAVNGMENDQSKSVRTRDRKGNKRDLDERMLGEHDEDVSSDEINTKMIDVEREDPGIGSSGDAGRGSKRNRGRGGFMT